MRNWGGLTSVLFVGAFVIGLHWGAVGVAAAYVGAGLTEISFLWWVGTRTGPLRPQDLLVAVYPYVLSSLITGVALRYLVGALPPGWLTLFIAGAASYLLFVASMLLLPQGRRSLGNVLGQLRRHLPLHRLGFRPAA